MTIQSIDKEITKEHLQMIHSVLQKYVDNNIQYGFNAPPLVEMEKSAVPDEFPAIRYDIGSVSYSPEGRPTIILKPFSEVDKVVESIVKTDRVLYLSGSSMYYNGEKVFRHKIGEEAIQLIKLSWFDPILWLVVKITMEPNKKDVRMEAIAIREDIGTNTDIYMFKEVS